MPWANLCPFFLFYLYRVSVTISIHLAVESKCLFIQQTGQVEESSQTHGDNIVTEGGFSDTLSNEQEIPT